MSLKLYFAPGSMPSRACRLLAAYLKLDIEIKTVDLAVVPVLVDGNFVLCESRAILAYLVNKYSPNSSLYPNDPQKRALIDQRLYYDATVVFESCAQIIRTVLYKQVKKIPQEQREKVSETLFMLEKFLSPNDKWFANNKLSIADISILPTITTIKELGYDLSKHQRLNEWYERCKSLPGYEDNVDGAKYLANRMFAILDDKL
ncbi:hypothetical protein PVAND_003541 [Polypedilum vanderplanki]|uniref:glutathione transferase n=1 Tax=Polypedilum vanderplanki TaxID=319348 RepID=A0A9J6BUD3_POLVA|nr:hypothetical protein PVAND_003541 [Polypedilum vanderplanki]